jgi:hypothetical protein
VLFGFIDDAHAALKNLADDFIPKVVIYAEQGHPRMVENIPALSSPAKGPKSAHKKTDGGIGWLGTAKWGRGDAAGRFWGGAGTTEPLDLRVERAHGRRDPHNKQGKTQSENRPFGLSGVQIVNNSGAPG